MTNREFIQQLQEFSPDLEIVITDWYECKCYHTNGISITIFENQIDIGIGGYEIEGE